MCWSAKAFGVLWNKKKTTISCVCVLLSAHVFRCLSLALRPRLKCVWRLCGSVWRVSPPLRASKESLQPADTLRRSGQADVLHSKDAFDPAGGDAGPTRLDGEQPEPGGRGRLLPVVRRPFTLPPVILTVWCGRLRAGGSPGLHSCCNDGGGEGGGQAETWQSFKV